MARYTFKKSEILAGKNEFREVFECGQAMGEGILRCIYRVKDRIDKCGYHKIKVGFAVSSTVRGSVKRNRIKRLLRETYRRHREILTKRTNFMNREIHIVLLFSPRQRLVKLPTYEEVNRSVESFLNRIAQMKENIQ